MKWRLVKKLNLLLDERLIVFKSERVGKKDEGENLTIQL